MSDELRMILEELKRRLTALYGDRLADLVLFGSQARGDAEPGSDIDVLVVLKGEVKPIEEIDRTLDILVNMSLDHDETVALVFMSWDEYMHKRTPLLLNVRREGVPI